jgi:hypothetical protein
MINGPMVGGFFIAVVLVVSTLFAGTWFRAAVAFSDARTLDAARGIRPIVCSFVIEDVEAKRSGQIHARNGILRFDIRDRKNDDVVEWGVEVDMNDGFMMSQATPDEPFVSLERYPNIRVQVLEDLKAIVRSEKVHCAPWWSGSSHAFNVETEKR